MRISTTNAAAPHPPTARPRARIRATLPRPEV